MKSVEDVQSDVARSLRSEDKPMEKHAPAAPFALVALSYLGVLALVSLILSVVFWYVY